MHFARRHSTRYLKSSCIAALLLTAACAAGQPSAAQTPPVAAQIDTLDPNYVPPGFGSLRQDDISLKVSPSAGLQVRATPLDERMIRLLSPDSYNSMRQLAASKQQALTTLKERNRQSGLSLWYVSFFSLEQGETRFSPQELIITNTGRDFRPIDILPLTSGFGEYRLKQRETQSALFVFDGQIDLNQPTSATMEGATSVTDWARVVQAIERERTLVRSRANSAAKKP